MEKVLTIFVLFVEGWVGLTLAAGRHRQTSAHSFELFDKYSSVVRWKIYRIELISHYENQEKVKKNYF